MKIDGVAEACVIKWWDLPFTPLHLYSPIWIFRPEFETTLAGSEFVSRKPAPILRHVNSSARHLVLPGFPFRLESPANFSQGGPRYRR